MRHIKNRKLVPSFPYLSVRDRWNTQIEREREPIKRRKRDFDDKTRGVANAGYALLDNVLMY